MKHLLLMLLLLAAAAGTPGCDRYEPAGVGSQYVVEAYLEAGSSLPPVRLSRTAPVGATYDFERLAVSGAEVSIQQVGRQVGSAPPVRYAEDERRPGLYRPVSAAEPREDRPDARRPARVEPLGRYRLTVHPPAGDGLGTEPVTAETVVPDTFRITRTSGDALVWRRDTLAVTVTPSAYPGRGARYVVTTTAFAPKPQNLTPLAAEALEHAGGDDFGIEDLAVTESPVINEGNYTVGPAGTLTIDIPWPVANFYGPNEIALRALDDNYYDFLRSQQVQQGGSTFSPGEIPNVIERVAGGTGLFGSYAEVRYRLDVERPGG